MIGARASASEIFASAWAAMLRAVRRYSSGAERASCTVARSLPASSFFSSDRYCSTLLIIIPSFNNCIDKLPCLVPDFYPLCQGLAAGSGYSVVPPGRPGHGGLYFAFQETGGFERPQYRVQRPLLHDVHVFRLDLYQLGYLVAVNRAVRLVQGSQ